MELKLDWHGDKTDTLTNTFVKKLTDLIISDQLTAGTKLPSIRDFAMQNNISRFTVVQVYDRLVASGYLVSRRGSGFYIASKSTIQLLFDETRIISQKNTAKADGATELFDPCSGHLPAAWLKTLEIEKYIRKVGRNDIDNFYEGYSNISGYIPLRKAIQQRLHSIGVVSTDIEQILTTSGALPAIDTICRSLLKPDDCVLIDDPGYYMIDRLLNNLDNKHFGVPWSVDGPDLEILEQLIKTQKPKLLITSAVCQSPTSVTLSPAVIHKILGLAEKYNFWIIEDDIYGVFHSNAAVSNAMRLATLDQINRVIYINSYSKTISGKLRLGYMIVPKPLIETILTTKAFGGRASEFSEKLLYELLAEGSYRKHVDHLIDLLQTAKEQSEQMLTANGLILFNKPEFGMYLWARFPYIEDSRVISEAAKEHGLNIMCGHHFSVSQEISPWVRFSVAWCQDKRLSDFLKDFTQANRNHYIS
jgi:DNA-binding transcriptional MocR family regulator